MYNIMYNIYIYIYTYNIYKYIFIYKFISCRYRQYIAEM